MPAYVRALFELKSMLQRKDTLYLLLLLLLSSAKQYYYSISHATELGLTETPTCWEQDNCDQWECHEYWDGWSSGVNQKPSQGHPEGFRPKPSRAKDEQLESLPASLPLTCEFSHAPSSLWAPVFLSIKCGLAFMPSHFLNFLWGSNEMTNIKLRGILWYACCDISQFPHYKAWKECCLHFVNAYDNACGFTLSKCSIAGNPLY